MTINYMNIIAGLLLLVIPAYLIWQLDRQQLRATAIGTLRMMVQVAVVGVLTMLVWRFDSLWLCLLWVVLTTVLTALVLLRRTQLPARRLFLPVAAGLLVSTLAVGSYELFVVLSPYRPTSAHWVIPVSGVLLAHSLIINIHALHTYIDALRGDSLPYYTAIGNGATRLRALLPYAARALHNGITPTTAKLATTALFAMPMLLAGLLMGGLSPLNAAFVFATLIVAAIVAAMLSLIITLWAADRQLFDRRGQFMM